MEDSSLKLKEQAQVICTMLCSEYGEQSVFLSVNPSNQTSTYLGSPYGKEFLENRMDIIEQFYNQCSGQQFIFKKDAETMTESTNRIIEGESSANQDAETMTENFESTILTNRATEPVSAIETEQLKRNTTNAQAANQTKELEQTFNSEKLVEKASTRTSPRLSKGKSANKKSTGFKTFNEDTVSLDIKTYDPRHVSVAETNTVLPSDDDIFKTEQPSGNRIIHGSQTISNEDLESLKEVEEHNNTLGDIFEDEYTDDEESDPEWTVTSSEPELSEKSVSNVNNLSDGSGTRRKSLRRRAKSQYLRDDQYDDSDYEEIKTTPGKSRERIAPEEKDRIFDIYVSGQRILQSVNELKEQTTEISLPETESWKTEYLHNNNSVKSKAAKSWLIEHLHSTNPMGSEGIETKVVDSEHIDLLGWKEARCYINFEDIKKEDIKPIMSDKPKQKYQLMKIEQRSSDGRYICPKCGQDFAAKEYAWWHIRVNHTGETPFKCEICGRLFQRMAFLQSHMTLHEKYPGGIPQPPAKLPSQMIIEVTSDGRYKCPECDRDFATKNWTEWHVRLKHTGQSPHVCNICNKAFSRKSHLQNHILIHNKNIRPFICEICGKTYQMKKSLQVHVQTHKLDGVAPSFKCPYPDCDQVFVTKARLDKHLQYKQSGRDFVCDKCGFASKLKQGLTRHILSMHSENRKPEFHCEQCNKYFHSKNSYTVHVNNHKGIARYVCDCCNMVFSSSSTLKRHYLRKAGLYVRPKSKNSKEVVFLNSYNY